MPATPLYNPGDVSAKQSGRLGRLTRRESVSLLNLKKLVRQQGLNLGLVRGPGEQNDVCLLRFLRAKDFEEKRALASLVSCVEWGASLGLAGLRGHPGGGKSSESVVPPAAEGIASFGSGVDRLGRPLVILRLGRLTDELVDACGKKALIRYFVWGVERVLERVAASMLANQFIVEGVVILCDAEGWNQEKFGDSVLSFLQEAAAVGLSYYPERLGQLLVVNVSPEDSALILLAVRALGLGVAIDSRRLRVLPGNRPEWAPELLQAIAPESLPVDFGGTAPALHPTGGNRDTPPSTPPANDQRKTFRDDFGGTAPVLHPSSGNRDTPPSTPLANDQRETVLSRLLAGGNTFYEVRGLHAVALLLVLWALHRQSARAGEAAILALAVALFIREWTGGAATPPTAKLRAPLLHDAGAGRAAGGVMDGGASAGFEDEGRGGMTAGSRVGGDGVGVSLDGARVKIVNIVEVIGTGQSGFDRFCIKLQATEKYGRDGEASVERREWVTWRRLIEFVALRNSLVKVAYPGADGADYHQRTWQLPPEVPADALARRLEVWLQKLIDSGDSASTREIRVFLGIESRLPTVEGPRTTQPLALNATHPSATIPESPPRSSRHTSGEAAPEKTVTSQLPELSDAVSGTESSRPDSLSSGDGEVDEPTASAGGGVGGGVAAREIPSLRPELKAMFQDPGECHTLAVPEVEKNRWLKRANRAAAHAPVTPSGTPAEALSLAGGGGAGGRKTAGPVTSAFGSPTPSSDGAHPPWDDVPEGKRGGPSHPRSSKGPSSPHRGHALKKRIVRLAKRKHSKHACPAEAALCRLLHVDVFQVPPDNHLHRVDHIVGLEGGRAQARVKQLTAKADGVDFLFVMNLQLPRSFTTECATSVVLYWGIPLEELSAEAGGTSATTPFQPSCQPVTTSWSSPILPPFERELLMRYIDLPFNRVDRVGSGLLSAVTTSAATPAGGVFSDEDRGNKFERKGGVEGKTGAVPSPELSAEEGDESESGVLSEKDFRNMSLKVVTSVVEGRWTVQKAVGEGNSQVLSRKLTQRFFRGSFYMETDVEIGSSMTSESVVGVCLTEPCVLDVGFFLEGGSRILCCVRTSHVNLALAEPLLLDGHTLQTPPCVKPLAATAPPSPPVRSGTASTPVVGPGLEKMPLGSPQFASTWEDNGETHTLRVRGPGYLSGGGRKVDAGRPFGRLVRADLFKIEAGVDRVDNIGSVGRAGKVVRHLQKAGEFLFMVNLQIPGNPPLSMVFYYAVPVPPGGEPEPGADGRSEGFLDLFRRFVDLGSLSNSDDGGSGDLSEDDGMGLEEAGGGGRLPGDDLRNLRFKLLPAIMEGPWIVRKAVGSKPTLIAQKLTCRYFRTRNYFEVDVDIGSSVVAYNTVSLAIGYAKSLVVDIGFCIQGEKEDELPEVLLGVGRLRRVDVLLADNLEANEDYEDGDYVETKKGGKDEDSLDGSEDYEVSPLSAVSPGGGVGEPGPIASPGLEDVFLDSGKIHGFRVRGASYLLDGRKISAGPSFGTLLRADLFRIDGSRHQLFRVDHICAHGRMKDRVASLLSGPNPPFLFVVNVQIPGDRAHSVVLCWGIRLKEAEEAALAGRLSREGLNFLKLFRRYINLDLEGGLPVNDIRNRRLKLFPKVLRGPWVVRKAIGKPCVVGRKLTARYFRRPDYFEVDIDVGSSTLASNATHLAGGYAKKLVLDLAFALQGEAEDELPERLIGSARIVKPDLGRAEALD